MWAQGVLPEWMYPKDTGIMVSVKNWPQGQWLEAIECGVEIAPIKYTKGGEIFIIGSPEFEEYYKYYVTTHSNLLSPISN